MPLPEHPPEPEALAPTPGFNFVLGEQPGNIAEIFDRVATERSWWIGTTRPDGRPHLSPVWGARADNHLIFSTGAATVKAMNLAANPAINLHLESGDDVVIIEGHARRLAPSSLPDGWIKLYAEKYGFEIEDPTDPEYRFYDIEPAKVFAWREDAFEESAARWRFASPD